MTLPDEKDCFKLNPMVLSKTPKLFQSLQAEFFMSLERNSGFLWRLQCICRPGICLISVFTNAKKIK